MGRLGVGSVDTILRENQWVLEPRKNEDLRVELEACPRCRRRSLEKLSRVHFIVYAQFQWCGTTVGQPHLKPSKERKLIRSVKAMNIVKAFN